VGSLGFELGANGDISFNSPIFLTHGVLIGEKFLNFRSVIFLIASIVSWRLVYAFIEKEKCSKEEETFG
jgi:hypothetical protein